MADSPKTPDEFNQLSCERRRKNKSNLQSFRRRCKRKLSLVSLYSMESTSSIGVEQCLNGNDGSATRPLSLVKDHTVQSLASDFLSELPMSSLADMNSSHNASGDDDEISVNSCSSFSTCSDDDSTEDDFNQFRSGTHLSDHRPLHSHTASSVQDFSIDVLEFCRFSRLPKNQRSLLLDLFRRYLPSPNLVPLTADSLGGKSLTLNRRSLLLTKKERCDEEDGLAIVSDTEMYFVEQSRVALSSWCSISVRSIKSCKTGCVSIIFSIETIGIGNLHHSERLCGVCQLPTTNGICSTTHCKHQDWKIPADDVVEIVSFNLIEQLRLLVNHNLNLLREYQQQARNRTTSDENDIVRADVYQSLLKAHAQFFVSVMIHADGIPLYKSKNCSAWPILGAVLELPPLARARSDNVLLLAIWIGKKKPSFEKILEKLSDQFSSLKGIGIELHDQTKVKIVFPMLMGDMPALSAMAQFVEPHAYYACMFRDTRGTYNHRGRCITYPVDNDAVSRTTATFRTHAELAASMQPRIDRERTIGHKGLSAFSRILDVPLPHVVVIDAMHTVFLCHSKKLLLHLQTFIGKDNLQKVSDKLHSMKYVHDILRRPRSISNLHRWKASEVRVFILYVGLPVLVEFLPEDESGDLAMYTIILRLLHDYWRNDKKQSDATSFLIKLYIEKLAKKIDSNVYPPNLLTITTHTHLHLPLQCKKFGRLGWLTNFVFESFLGYLEAFVKGSSGAGDQIAFAFESNFILSKINEVSRAFGHFSINEKDFGSNVIKLKGDDPLHDFLSKNGHTSANTLIFSRLHQGNVTYHSFLYTREGSACSYLVSYDKDGITSYGFIVCFLKTDGRCSVVVQPLTRVNRSLSVCFSSYEYITAIRDFIDDLYIVVKRVEPSLFDFNNTHICSVDSLQSRCFSVPLGSDLMVITNYSCAFEHNWIKLDC